MMEAVELKGGALDRARRILAGHEDQATAFDDVYQELTNSPDFEDRVALAVAARVTAGVEVLSSQIEARARERQRALLAETEEQEARVVAEWENLEIERSKAEREIAETWNESHARISEREQQLKQLETQVEEKLRTTLDKLQSGRDAVIGDFIALEPLMRRLFGGGGSVATKPGEAAPTQSPAMAPAKRRRKRPTSRPSSSA